MVFHRERLPLGHKPMGSLNNRRGVNKTLLRPNLQQVTNLNCSKDLNPDFLGGIPNL